MLLRYGGLAGAHSGRILEKGGFGGGVGLLPRDGLALVETPRVSDAEPGRLEFGMLPLRPQIVTGSIYGLTRNALREQNGLWKCLAGSLLMLGLAFA